MFNKGSLIPKDVIVNVLFPYLDQVSIFRLARCSKTLFETLQPHVPKQAVLDYFNWQFKTANIASRWKMARKRHESDKWCLGGCGKQRKPCKESLFSLIVSKRTRVLKAPLNICASCSGQRNTWIGVDDDIHVLRETKRLKGSILRRNKYDPFLPILNKFEMEETKQSARIKDAKIGDVLVPKFQSYDMSDALPELQIVDIILPKRSDKNELDRIFVMEDGTTISSYDGLRWIRGSSSNVWVYVKHPDYYY